MSEATPGATWDGLGRAAASQRDGDEPTADLVQLIVFTLGGSPYAVPVERVREIVRIRPITPVPRMPAAVLGVISLRGEILQVVDLRRRLSLAPEEPGSRSRVIVVHSSDDRMAGLLVDGVDEVMRVSDDALRPPSTDSGSVEALCSRGDAFVSLIDLDRVLDVGDDD